MFFIRPTASIASLVSSTKKPVLRSKINSFMAPRLNAITGVPHIIASATLKPKGSSKLIGCKSADAFPNNSFRWRGPALPK